MSTLKLKTQVIAPEYAALSDFVESLPTRFASEGVTLHDGRNTVKRFTVGGQTLVVKRYKRPNVVQRIAYTFFERSKAERAYVFAGILRDRRISTPHEVAYIEQSSGGLLTGSYFVSEECAWPSLREALERPDFDRTLAAALGRYLVTLHERHIAHGDLNLGNILYHTQADGTYAFALIDTNRSHFGPLSRRDCLRNLLRLTYDTALMDFVVREYATSRGWDADRFAADELHLLHRFWVRNDRKNKMKKILRRLPFRKTPESRK